MVDDSGCQLPGQPLIFENVIYFFMIYSRGPSGDDEAC